VNTGTRLGCILVVLSASAFLVPAPSTAQLCLCGHECDLTIDSELISGLYERTACNTISTTGTVTVQVGAFATFTAGKSVAVDNGFSVLSPSELTLSLDASLSCDLETDLDEDLVSECFDCDDDNEDVFPGADELCDGLDNDCNELVDEDFDPNDDPACESEVVFLGTIAGDILSGQVSDSTWNEEWLRVTLSEESDAQAYLSADVELVSAPGTDFDLYVYCDSCGGALAGSSTTGGLSGHTDAVEVRKDDSFGTDDTFDIYIEIRHSSSNICALWSLTVTGNTTVSSPTCN
jgi:hypothetical protein